jgi:hypothetical protein
MKHLVLKLLALVYVIMAATVTGDAQVTIGANVEPDYRAILELKSNNKAFLPPRVALQSLSSALPVGSSATEHLAGLVVYNLTNNPAETLVEGLYYNNGTRWVRIINEADAVFPKWFYMPSIPLNVSSSSTFQRDLWLEYRKQFADDLDTSTPSNSPVQGVALIKNPSAPAGTELPVKLYEKNQLNYYITGYDVSAFSNVSVNNDGVLTYTVNADNVSDSTYMNIVFVVK